MYDWTGIITAIPGSIGITIISYGMSPPYRTVTVAVPVDRQRPVVIVQRQGRSYINSCVGGTNIHMG